MTRIRQCVPGQFSQGVDEELSYAVDVGNWATAPTGASAVVKIGASDVSSLILRSAASVPTISGSLITTPCLVGLSAGTDYRIELKFEQSAKLYECFFFVTGGV